MSNPIPKAQATAWLAHLYEVGAPITNMIREEESLLLDIQEAQIRIRAKRLAIRELAKRAEKKVATLWGPTEIAEAKARA